MRKTATLVTWIVRLIGIILLLFLVGGAITFFQKPNTPPSVDDAMYGIQTYSSDSQKVPDRIYYTNDIEIIDGKPSIPEGAYYWTYDGNKYHRHVAKDNFLARYQYLDIVRR